MNTDATDETDKDQESHEGFSKEERAAFEQILAKFDEKDSPAYDELTPVSVEDAFKKAEEIIAEDIIAALKKTEEMYKKERKMNLLKIAPALPTMAIPFGIYCVLSALTSVDLIDILFIPTLVGTPIGLTGGEFIVGLGIIALGVEIAKSVSIKNISTADHAFSTVLLTLMVLLVFAVNGFQNASFLALVMLQALDVLAGVLVTLSVARRDFGFPGIGGGND
jgi:hypothetical protein